MSIKHINTSDEFKEILKNAGDKIVLVDWFAQWCGPCKRIGPDVEKLAKDEAETGIVCKVDVDEVPDLAAEHQITAMPTFSFFKGGKKLNEFKGADPKKLRVEYYKNAGRSDPTLSAAAKPAETAGGAGKTEAGAGSKSEGDGKKAAHGVRHIEDKAVFDALLKDSGDKLIVVDWFATWCPPCMRIAPEVEKLAEVETDTIFVKVDVDHAKELSEAHEIEAMPTFMFFKGGKKVHTFMGADLKQLKETVAKHKGK